MLRKVKKRYSIIRDKIKHFKFKNSYSNNIGEENDYDDLEFVWGIKSWDDITSTEANLYTMNDLDIVYDRKRNEYMLGIETIYLFADGNNGEIKYLEYLLGKFTEFMRENNYISPDEKFCLRCIESVEPWRANTISELYIRFKVFVQGYKAVISELS